MTKTITQFRPLIYDVLLVSDSRRRQRRRGQVRKLGAFLLVGYVLLAMNIIWSAEIPVWDIRFWAIFGPLYLIGERVLSAAKRACV